MTNDIKEKQDKLDKLDIIQKQAFELIKEYNTIATAINHNDRLGIVGSQIYNENDDLDDEDRYDEDGYDENGYNCEGLDEDGNAKSDVENYDQMIDNDYSIRGLWVQAPEAAYGWFASATGC